MQYIASTLGAIVSVPLSIEELEALRDAPALKKVIQTRLRPAILAFLMKILPSVSSATNIPQLEWSVSTSFCHSRPIFLILFAQLTGSVSGTSTFHLDTNIGPVLFDHTPLPCCQSRECILPPERHANEYRRYASENARLEYAESELYVREYCSVPKRGYHGKRHHSTSACEHHY